MQHEIFLSSIFLSCGRISTGGSAIIQAPAGPAGGGAIAGELPYRVESSSWSGGTPAGCPYVALNGFPGCAASAAMSGL